MKQLKIVDLYSPLLHKRVDYGDKKMKYFPLREGTLYSHLDLRSADSLGLLLAPANMGDKVRVINSMPYHRFARLERYYKKGLITWTEKHYWERAWYRGDITIKQFGFHLYEMRFCLLAWL